MLHAGGGPMVNLGYGRTPAMARSVYCEILGSGLFELGRWCVCVCVCACWVGNTYLKCVLVFTLSQEWGMY